MSDVEFLNQSWAVDCGMLLAPDGVSVVRAPDGWAADAESAQDGRKGRWYYRLDAPEEAVWVPLLP